jgi:hypothetical protein
VTGGFLAALDRRRRRSLGMADVLFAIVTVVSFALLILFVYGCERA